ncbi:MAG: hypothetical protein L3J12_03150 [Spirochaetales bacterium]|nr:hypothetical protein [Spirochaetales bacterium]
MKKIMLAIGIIFIITTGVFAEKSISLGYEIGEIGNDFIMGGRITSPFVFGGSAAARISGDAVWNKTDGSSYGFFRAGLIGSSGLINKVIRLYGEGGMSLLWNADGADRLVFGGYGLFGFEFFTGVNSPLSYFIEMGTLGGSVSRLTGFNTRTGLSVYF